MHDLTTTKAPTDNYYLIQPCFMQGNPPKNSGELFLKLFQAGRYKYEHGI